VSGMLCGTAAWQRRQSVPSPSDITAGSCIANSRAMSVGKDVGRWSQQRQDTTNICIKGSGVLFRKFTHCMYRVAVTVLVGRKPARIARSES
jgi:hypothetical protein